MKRRALWLLPLMLLVILAWGCSQSDIFKAGDNAGKSVTGVDQGCGGGGGQGGGGDSCGHGGGCDSTMHGGCDSTHCGGTGGKQHMEHGGTGM